MSFSQWWRDTSKLLKFVIAFGAGVVTISSATTAWIGLGLFVPASRYYVHQEVVKIAVPVLGLAIEQRNRLRRNRDELIARKSIAVDDQRKADLVSLIEQADQDIIDVEAQITALQRFRMD